MLGTACRPGAETYAYAVNLLREGLPAQYVTQVTGVYARDLMGLARINPTVRPGYEPPPAPPPGRSRAEQVIQEVADKHGITAAAIRGQDRSRGCAWPRQEAMYRLHKELRIKSTAVGRMLGGRDHTTVLYGVAEYEARVLAGVA